MLLTATEYMKDHIYSCLNGIIDNAFELRCVLDGPLFPGYINIIQSGQIFMLSRYRVFISFSEMIKNGKVTKKKRKKKSNKKDDL